MPSDPERTVIDTSDARAGVTDHNVRYVLGFGPVAVIAAFVLVYLFYFS
jgi:hypothetical protein